MKRSLFVVIAACICLMGAFCSCARNEKKEEEPIAQIPNPFITADTIDEAVKGSGIDAVFPDSIPGYDGKSITYIKGEFIQVIYGGEEKNVYARKGVLTEDLSGDYNTYSDIKELELHDIKAELRGEKGMYSTAVWNTKTHSFALMFSEPVDEETIRDIMSQMQ